MNTRTIIAALLLLVACDSAPEPVARVGGFAAVAENPAPVDCRAAHFCVSDCTGAAFLDGVAASDVWSSCLDRCEPSASDAADHFGWWTDAVEVTCEDDWTDACVVPELRPDLTSTLSGVTLYSCMRQGV